MNVSLLRRNKLWALEVGENLHKRNRVPYGNFVLWNVDKIHMNTWKDKWRRRCCPEPSWWSYSKNSLRCQMHEDRRMCPPSSACSSLLTTGHETSVCWPNCTSSKIFYIYEQLSGLHERLWKVFVSPSIWRNGLSSKVLSLLFSIISIGVVICFLSKKSIALSRILARSHPRAKIAVILQNRSIIWLSRCTSHQQMQIEFQSFRISVRRKPQFGTALLNLKMAKL